MKLFDFIKKTPRASRFGYDVLHDLTEDSDQMNRDEIASLFCGFKPWFLEPGYKADPYNENGEVVIYIQLCEYDIGIDDGFGPICFVRHSCTNKKYQLVKFDVAQKRIEEHETKKYESWLTDCANGNDGEA